MEETRLTLSSLHLDQARSIIVDIEARAKHLVERGAYVIKHSINKCHTSPKRHRWSCYSLFPLPWGPNMGRRYALGSIASQDLLSHESTSDQATETIPTLFDSRLFDEPPLVVNELTRFLVSWETSHLELRTCRQRLGYRRVREPVLGLHAIVGSPLFLLHGVVGSLDSHLQVVCWWRTK